MGCAMKTIFPKYIDWTTPPELGFKSSSVLYSAALHDYALTVGKVRRQFAFSVIERYIAEVENIIAGNEAQQFLCILPFFPIRIYNANTDPLIGETSIDVSGNIYNRPMTFVSDFKYANIASRFGVLPFEQMLILNNTTDDIEINRILSAVPDNTWGEKISYMNIELESAISIDVTKLQFRMYNFFYARLVNDNSTEYYNDRTGAMTLQFEEIFENEVPS